MVFWRAISDPSLNGSVGFLSVLKALAGEELCFAVGYNLHLRQLFATMFVLGKYIQNWKHSTTCLRVWNMGCIYPANKVLPPS